MRAGTLDGRTNLLVVAPTSSGKTFVGELAATSSAYARRRHAIFIVPFRALADEHYRLFRERYGHLLSVVISTSDWTEFDADIRVGNFNLAVMTYEKLMALSIQQPDVVERCTTLVVDEVQSLSDSSRARTCSETNIARETSSRSILLVPMPVFAEALVVAEGAMNAEQLGDVLAHRRGTLAVGDLPEPAA